MPMQHRILALAFHDFEALDLFGPLGSIVPRSDYYKLKVVNIHNFDAPNGLESSIKNGIGVLPTLSLAEALKTDEQFDTLFIPGGFGVMPLVWDPILLQKIAHLVDLAANVFTVCTGSNLLAATGKLDGRRATTNKRLYEEITPRCMWNLSGLLSLVIDLLFRSQCSVAKACPLGARWQVFDFLRDHRRYRRGFCLSLQYICFSRRSRSQSCPTKGKSPGRWD